MDGLWNNSITLAFVSDNILSHPFLSRFKNKALNIKSYQSILQITLTAPSVNLTNFYREIVDKAKEKFKVPYHSKIAPVISVRAAYLYDAVTIYAQAATRMLKDGGDLRDGRTLMQKYVFNNMYTSKQGFQVISAQTNTRAVGFSFIICLLRFWSTRMEMPKGTFPSFPCSMSTKRPWPCNKWARSCHRRTTNCPASNWAKRETSSGWMACRRTNRSAASRAVPTIGASSSQVYLFSSLSRSLAHFSLSRFKVSLLIKFPNYNFREIISRHYRYEQKLQSIMWKVDVRDITFLGTEYNEEAYRTGNITQLFRHRTMSLFTGDTGCRRAYTTIGKGRIWDKWRFKRIHCDVLFRDKWKLQSPLVMKRFDIDIYLIGI